MLVTWKGSKRAAKSCDLWAAGGEPPECAGQVTSSPEPEQRPSALRRGRSLNPSGRRGVRSRGREVETISAAVPAPRSGRSARRRRGACSLASPLLLPLFPLPLASARAQLLAGAPPCRLTAVPSPHAEPKTEFAITPSFSLSKLRLKMRPESHLRDTPGSRRRRPAPPPAPPNHPEPPDLNPTG